MDKQVEVIRKRGESELCVAVSDGFRVSLALHICIGNSSISLGPPVTAYVDSLVFFCCWTTLS